MLNLYALCANIPQWLLYGVDAIVLLAALIFMFVCARRGFVNCFFAFFSLLAGVIAAAILAKPVVGWTNGLFGLQDFLTTKFTASFSKLEGFGADISATGVEAALADKNLPAVLTNFVISKFTGQTLEAGTTLGTLLGETTASFATTIISFLAILILCRLLCLLLRKILGAIVNHLSLVKVVDSLLGALFGVMEVLLFVCVALSILMIIPSQGISDFLGGTIVLKALYEYNPLVTVIGWFL